MLNKLFVFVICICFCVSECIVFRHCYPLVNEIASYFPYTTNVDPMFLSNIILSVNLDD